MAEPLTTQLVAEQMQKLLSAFPSRNVAGQNVVHTAEVYRNGLRGLSGDSVRAAIDLSIQQDVYFPKVARLRELAHQWARYNEIRHSPAPADADELWCRNCGTRAVFQERWRPIANAMFRPVLTDDKRYVFLEPYSRLLCQCAAPCAYRPIDGVEPPMMLRAGAVSDPEPEQVAHAAD